MWQKVWAISRVDIFNTFTDRVAIIMMLVVPLALSIIMGAAFGESSSDISIQKADVGIINNDSQFFGALYPCVLLSEQSAEQATTCQQMFGSPENELDEGNDIADFINGISLTDAKKGRQQVDDGDLDVLLVIPEDFSQQILSGNGVKLELYYNAGGGIPVDVARSIIEGMTIQLNTGAIAMQIIPEYANAQGIEGADSPQLMGQIQFEAFTRSVQDVIRLETQNVEGDTQDFNALQYFAPSMAIFFMTFGMANGARSVLDDMHNWTLQRIITTPTTKWAYLAGKSIGTYASGIFQMVLLIVATIFVSSVIFGNEIAIWGTNIPAIALLVISVVAAATGLGMIIASLGQNSEQVNSISTIILVVMAMVGGSFIPVDDVPIVNQLSKLTLNHWSLEGFITLSLDDGSLVDVLPNIAILFLMGIVFYGIAIQLFNRRLDF